MPVPVKSLLDPGQVLQHAFDDTTGKLRVDAVVTATIAGPFEVAIAANADNIAIRNTSNNNELLINPDGSINTNVSGNLQIEISAADGDSIAISDGTNTLAVNVTVLLK